MSRDLLRNCTLCPRNCHVDRVAGQAGYCRTTAELVVARAALHHWEEPCISGEKGSGTVFFSGCAMGCVFCQNHKISRGMAGKKITVERLSEIFLNLQGQGAHNVNLVTPSHYVPQIVEAVTAAKDGGLHLPIVYNSSGYEKVETLRLLEGHVDVYLPDLKYMASDIASRYSNAADYFTYASRAVDGMLRQVGEPVFDADGMMTRGVIVRHLALPGCLDDSTRVIKYLYETFRDSIYISIMSQYTPLSPVEGYPELNRRISEREYNALVGYAIALGVENGFVQEGEAALESFIPEFNGEGVM